MLSRGLGSTLFETNIGICDLSMFRKTSRLGSCFVSFVLARVTIELYRPQILVLISRSGKESQRLFDIISLVLARVTTELYRLPVSVLISRSGRVLEVIRYYITKE